LASANIFEKDLMSLTDLARQAIAPREVRPPSQGGTQSSHLADYVAKRLQGHSNGYADSTIATVVWQILRKTEAYQLLVSQLGGTPAIWRLGDFVVTGLSEANVSRFVLLALDPTLPTNTPPKAAEVKFKAADLYRAFNQWARRMQEQADYGRYLVEAVNPKIVTEFAEMQGLYLALGAMPLEFEYTAERPTPPYDIKDSAGSHDFSMGVYSDSKLHGAGITTAAHAITAGTSYDIFDSGSLIDSVRGIAVNSVLDSAFLKLNGAPSIASPVGKTFLSGIAPDIKLRHDFHGAQSGPMHASVSGWVDDLLTVEPWLQNRVFTNRILQHRDSGAALIDANDRTIGFAFYNSSPFKNPTSSAWIWADSVAQDFQLR
jgi:hypothetical protein